MFVEVMGKEESRLDYEDLVGILGLIPSFISNASKLPPEDIDTLEKFIDVVEGEYGFPMFELEGCRLEEVICKCNRDEDLEPIVRYIIINLEFTYVVYQYEQGIVAFRDVNNQRNKIYRMS